MSYDIQFPNIPAGYTLNSARGGEQARAIAREFTSSEDGEIFISRLEGFPSEIIDLLPSDAPISPSMIDHLVAVIRRDNTATVHINELPFVVKTRVKRSIEKGEIVFADDIADIEEAEFEGIDMPEDAGVVIVFSVGWRKGLFFDFCPLHKPYPKRSYDLWKLLGHYLGYLSFQHLFKITEPEWSKLSREQWFPFVTLKHTTIRKMLSYVRAEWKLDELLEMIAREVHDQLDASLERWANSNVLEPHMLLLERAIERYQKADYVSATAILYPRIEGIMRTLNNQSPQPVNTTQRNLAAVAMNAYKNAASRYSLLLPHRFRQYIEDVYFADFVPGGSVPLSRNSVGHGVAASHDFTLKAATIGLLIVDQIFYHIVPNTTSPA